MSQDQNTDTNIYPPNPEAGSKLQASTPSVWNIANFLTVLRLLMVPAFIMMLAASNGENPGWLVAATITFAIAAATDYYDGVLARAHNLVTSFGKLADPIADKALTGSALVGLSIFGWLPWWVTIVIAFREVGVTLLRFWVIKHGVMAASKGGKLKTVLQLLAIGWYLWPWSALGVVVSDLTHNANFERWIDYAANAAPWLMGIAVVLTISTGIDYVVRAWRLHRVE